MKVLVLGRMFSGLADGLSEGRWDPRGVPAFYKLVEGLKADSDVTVRTVLFCKDPDPRFTSVTRHEFEATGPIEIVPWRAPTLGYVRKLDRLVTESDHIIRVLLLAAKGRADVIYATYALVFSVAIVARFSSARVVLRLMGIFPQHREMATGRHRLLGWALRAPFRTVVCTEDGSDPSEVLPSLLNPRTTLNVRLNGCDVDVGAEKARPSKEKERLKVLFLGRLEPYKGADAFIEAALIAEKLRPFDLEFEVIGDGRLRESLEARALEGQSAEHTKPNIRFHGALPHDAVADRLRQSDVYVSVNLHGNLSNANLEALAAGCAMVLPAPDPAIPIDLSTMRMIPETAARRYDRDEIVTSLASVLAELAADRQGVQEMKAASRKTAKALIGSWTERINADIENLKGLTNHDHMDGIVT